jgi:RNA polymerase primary sigma factor
MTHTHQMASQRALLTAHEEIELAERIARGRTAQSRVDRGAGQPGDRRLIADAANARRHFVEANVRLVISVANKTRAPRHIDRDDMIQDGLIGLDRAVTKFDPSKGFRFSTYATWWIRQAIQRGMESTDSIIKIPAHRASELRTHGAGGQTFDNLSPTLRAAVAASRVDSLDRPVGSDDEPLGNITPCSGANPADVALQLLDDEALRELVDTLEATTRFAVVRRFGLDGNPPATFVEIGAELGIGPEAARRRVLRACDRLRDQLELIAA